MSILELTLVCSKCHILKPITAFYSNRYHQQQCKECYHQQNKDWYNRNKIERNKQIIHWRSLNKDKVLTYNKVAIVRLKTKVLTHYGNGKCACVWCGESRINCLSIDHVNGNGNQHRKSLTHGKMGGTKTFYRWLIKINYPLEYRTLCMNCQFMSQFETAKANRERRKQDAT